MILIDFICLILLSSFCVGVCISVYMQKQPSRGVLRKRCSENMQWVYRRRPMLKCDFNLEGCLRQNLRSCFREIRLKVFSSSKHLVKMILHDHPDSCCFSESHLTQHALLRFYNCDNKIWDNLSLRRRVSGNSFETLWTLCVFKNIRHQEVKSKYFMQGWTLFTAIFHAVYVMPGFRNLTADMCMYCKR